MAPQLKADLALRVGAGEFVDVSGAAGILDVSVSFLNKKRLTAGGPPYAKFGKSVRYNVAGLLDWAAAQGRMSTSDEGKAHRSTSESTREVA
jgi:hypothetical protein